jgi:DNA-binding transcriptional LysR family regulator
MIINQLNLNQIRVFECVYRTKSMTAAARELHLTQSGISQHIKSLEEFIGIPLFDRINQRVVPTPNAALLYEKCKKSLITLEEAFSEVQAEKNELAGRVHIGMPTEFGNNVVIPLIGQISQKHPKLKFHFRLGYGVEMMNMVLRGEVDFAFLDEMPADKKIRTQVVYDEHLELCISPSSQKTIPPESKQNLEYFESLPYVDFSKDEQILRRWFQHHFGGGDPRLLVKSTIEDTQGVARLVVSGIGAGILPGHLVGKLQKEGIKLHVFKGRGVPTKNSILVATLKERTETKSVGAVYEFLMSGLQNLKKGKNET